MERIGNMPITIAVAIGSPIWGMAFQQRSLMAGIRRGILIRRSRLKDIILMITFWSRYDDGSCS